MATNWSLQLAPQALAQLSSGAVREVSNRLQIATNRSWGQIRHEVGRMLSQALEISDVIQSLRGNTSVDLAAHLGLTDDLANNLADGMVSMMVQGIEYQIFKTTDGIIIKINAVPTAWEAYNALPGAQYFSVNTRSGTSILIPVAHWLLIDPNLDIGQLQYSILFAHETARDISITSRSGRAIMVGVDSPEGGDPYFLPGIVQKKLGLNFIEYVIGNPEIARKIVYFVMDKIMAVA